MNNKTFLYINVFIFFIPLYLLIPAFYNGNQCAYTAEGKIVLPEREFKFICKNGIYDLYHYFPDGSIRHHSGLYLNYGTKSTLIKLNEKMINYHLKGEALNSDVLNRGVNIAPFSKYNDRIEIKLFDKELIKRSYNIKDLVVHKQKKH